MNPSCRLPLLLVPLALIPSAARAQDAPPAAPLRLTLAEAQRLAAENGPRLAQLDDLRRAAEQARRAASAARGPQVNLEAAASRLSDVPELVLPLPGAGPTTIAPNIPGQYRTRAQVALPLYAGGRLRALEGATAAELEAATLDAAAGARDLVLETAAAYWVLVAARENERVLGEAIRAYDAHLADARNRQKVGLAAANEVLAVQVERDAAELSRLAAANDATLAEADLARLVGLPVGARIETADAPDGTRGPAEPLEELVGAAIARRPEHRAGTARAAAADARARALAAETRPQVTAQAGYDWANPNRRFFPLAESWRPSWDATIAVGWKLFDAGRARAQAAEAQARADATRRGVDDLDRRIRIEVTRRALDLETARASVALAESTLVAARENLRVAGERYRAGVSPSSELLDAETALLRAALTRVQALANVEIARAGLDRATGR